MDMGYLSKYTDIFCNNFDRKVYLCKSLPAGRRLVKSVAKEGKVVYGVEVETLKSLISKEYGADKNMLSPYKAQNVIYDFLCESENVFWDKEGASSRQVAKELHQLFTEFDLGKVTSIKSTDTQVGGTLLRIAAIEDIRAKYSTYKKNEDVYEYPDLLSAAIKSNAEDNVDRGYSLYIDESCEFSVLEQMYIEGLNDDLIISVKNEEVLDQEKKREILSEAKKKSSLIQCKGNESDFIFTDILANKCAFEDTAIMLWDGIDIYSLYTKAASMGIPLTMTQGIPLRSSTLYQILKKVKEFVDADYSAEILYAMFSRNVFRLKKQKVLADILVKYKVSLGRERYEDIFINKIETVLSEVGRELEEAEINGIKEFFTDIIELQDGSVEQQRDKLVKFADQYTYHIDEEHVQAFSTTKKLIYEVGELNQDNLLGTLLEFMEDKTYMNNIAGGVYCTGITDDVYAKRVYMCGMISGKVPVSPLVFEEDREATPGLKTYRDLEQEKEVMFYKMLEKHEGELIFTYESYNVEKLVSTTPNYFYGCMRNIGLNDRITQLQIPESTEGEDNRVHGTKKRGKIISHKEQVKDIVFSATSLESALECPLRFYIEKILGVREDELYKVKDHEWLAANEKGTFVHEVLDRYYAYVLDNNGEEDSAKLEEFINNEKIRYKEMYYCYNEEMQVAELQTLEDTVKETVKFFENEDEGYQIHSTEKGFGKDGEIFEIEIKGGKITEKIKFTGSIDRVDVDKQGNLRVVDYKTGRIDDFINKQKIPKKLQAYLYKLAMETLAKSEPDEYKGKYVGKAHYYFTQGNVMLSKDCTNDAGLLLELMEVLKDKDKSLGVKINVKTTAKVKDKIFETKSEEVPIKPGKGDGCKCCKYTTFCTNGGK